MFILDRCRCCDTCEIWMIFNECSRYFRQIEKFAYGAIVTPTPGQHGGYSLYLYTGVNSRGTRPSGNITLTSMCQLSKNHKLLHSTTVVNKQVGYRGSFDCFFVVGSHRDQSCHPWMQVFAPVTLHNGLTFIIRYEQLLFCDWFRDRRGIIWQEWILWCFCRCQNMAAVKLVRTAA